MSSSTVSFTSLIGKTLLFNDKRGGFGEVATGERLKGKLILLYCSAQWCNPCRLFTPVLIDVYEQAIKAGRQVEVILASSDDDPEEFAAYFKKQPWLCVPYAQMQKKGEDLRREFGVSGIPALIVLGPSGQLISSSARSEIKKDGLKAIDRWIAACKNNN